MFAATKTDFCMKKMICAAIALFLTASAMFAQNSKTIVISETARAATEKMVTKFQLDAAQTAKMEQVQQQKIANLAAIEPLKSSNPTKFRAKMKNLHEGSRGSLAIILNTKEQKEMYRKMLVEIREQKAVVSNNLTAKKASKSEIETALLDVDAQF
jgi:hypothetical protein